MTPLHGAAAGGIGVGVALQFPTPSPGVGMQFPTPGPPALVAAQAQAMLAHTAAPTAAGQQSAGSNRSSGPGISTECDRAVQMLPHLRCVGHVGMHCACMHAHTHTHTWLG